MRVDLQVLSWRLRVDPEATRSAHEAMGRGGAESCGCIYCRNFAASRQSAYPPQALDIFARLGMRTDRETEIGAPVRMPDGRWLYGGWFHFVGEIVGGPRLPTKVATVPAEGPVMGGTVRALQYEALVNGFDVAFSEQTHLLPEPFKGQHVIQLEFSTAIRWILGEQEPAS